MRICIPFVLKSDQKEYDVEDLISDGDVDTPCQSPLHVQPSIVDPPKLSSPAS